jgi:polysaccharide pyruvyl transferase CsaB
MSDGATGLRIAIYAPDRARTYDGRTRDEVGVGGGITARLSMAEALAALGHHVTAYVHCEAPLTHRAVSYVPVGLVTAIECDVLIAISTGGAMTLAPLRTVQVDARIRILWVQGVPQPKDIDAVRADYVYVASNFLRGVCAKEWRIPPNRLFVSYNGLHQDTFREAAADAPPRDPFAIAFIGPPEKGLESCIRVLRAIRMQEPRFHLDILGGAALWGRAQQPPAAQEGVIFRGLLGQRDLARELFRYEYLLALQDMAEGFGIAVQEAKRAGIIVFASAVGAFPELIRHGSDGYLVHGAESSDSAQGAAARLLLDLSRDPLRRDRIRRRAMETPWDWQLAARTWTEHWRWVLSRPAGAAPSFLDLPDGRHRLTDGLYFPSVYPLSPLNERLGIAAPHHVLVAGYYGHRNLGDEAILSVALDEWQRARPDLLPVVASADPDATKAAHDVDAVDERDIAALSQTIQDAAATVLGGGGLFHDIHGADESAVMTSRHSGVPLCMSLAILSQQARTPLIIQNVGLGPLTTPTARRLTRSVFEAASFASVRDAESQRLLDEVSDHTLTAAEGADFVYLLPSADPDIADRILREAGLGGSRGVIAVALRHWTRDPDPDAREAAIAAALDRIAADERLDIAFVAFQSGDDRDTDDLAAADRVRRRMTRPSLHLPANLNASVVQAVFSRCQAVLSMRLHGLILAANARVPFVALQHEDKIPQALRAMGLPDEGIDLSKVTPDVLAERLRSAMRAGARFSQTLGRTLPGLQASARESVRAAARTIAPVLAPRAAAAPNEPIAPVTPIVPVAPIEPVDPMQSGAPVSIGRRVARALVPRAWRRPLRSALQTRVMTRAAFAFDAYWRARRRMVGADISGIRTPGIPDLISVVLPVYNGGDMLHEAIDSVLAQTYASFELIVVDDGSNDGSGEVADACAARDPRVRVVHQSNQRLPAALTEGFRHARGEFLTWASADNRWRPDAFAKLVDDLRRHPARDVVYANLDLIGDDGQPLSGSRHFHSYQRPAGSAHVDLPSTTEELNTRDNNFIGAGFLYRRRVSTLIGDYSTHRFGVEDYDYWMRANALLNVGKADFQDSVIDYRFHTASLTARSDALGLPAARARLLVFDDFRRDAALWPLVWIIDPAIGPALEFRRCIREAGHIAYDDMTALEALPAPWVPVVCVSSNPEFASTLEATRRTTATLNVWLQPDSSINEAAPSADLRVYIGSSVPASWSADDRASLVAPDVSHLFHAIDIRARAALFADVEALAHTPLQYDFAASIVICVAGPIATLDAVVSAALGQNVPADRFEVIVVNNRPADPALADALRRLPSAIRVVPCPIPGHSAARNAGLGAARGRYVCYLDDDAVPDPQWLGAVCRAFDEHADTGVVGGPILLEPPAPAPAAFTPGWAGFWSHFAPTFREYREVTDRAEFPWGASWAARRDVLYQIGGFRLAFGRRGGDHRGGEELVAALMAQRLGYRIAIAPDAVVHHRVDASRYTFEHVKGTQTARHLVAQRAVRDLVYESRGGLLGSAVRLLVHHVDPRVRTWPHVVRDIAYRKAAQWAAFRTDVADVRRRFRRPDRER